MSGKDWEELPEVRVGSRCTSEGWKSLSESSRGVTRPFRRSGWGWEALLKVQAGSRGPLRCLERVGRPSHRYGRGQEASPRSEWGREALPKVQEGSEGPP